MAFKIQETKRKFANNATDLSNSDGHTFESALNVFLDFCESDDLMRNITKPLKERSTVDMAKWYEDFSKSGGSMIGSGRFVLPANEEDRLSLLYRLLLRVRSGEIGFPGFCLHAFGATSTDQMAHRFNEAISRPLARGLLQRLDALETEEKARKPSLDDATFGFVLSKLESLGWNDARRELDRAIKAFDDGRMPDCCNNLRMGLMTVLAKIYEILEEKQLPIQPGKTVDITPLTKSLESHGYAADFLGLIRQTWSFVSERAHVDKRSGQAPAEHDAEYALQITFAAVRYSLAQLDRIGKG